MDCGRTEGHRNTYYPDFIPDGLLELLDIIP